MVSNVVGKLERVEVRRSRKEALEVEYMLVNHGFAVELEPYICGFWLIHWSFPRLQVVR